MSQSPSESQDVRPSAARTLVGQSEAPSGGSAAEGPSSSRVEPGTVVGRYVVLSRIGAGGMGIVYVAYDPELDRKVALKILRRPPRHSAGSRARQLREAQALARLTHPNVVTVYDVGVFAERPFLAMELVEGATLRQWLAERPRGWREVLPIFVGVGQGLEAAHAAGIVHLDLKPDNIMVSRDGRVLVTDFGLARVLDSATSTSSGSHELSGERIGSDMATRGLRGTPGYMAPEQYRGRPGDERVDQFGFCVTFWEALHGTRPYGGETAAEVLHSIARGRICDPPAGRSVPRFVLRIVERGLAREPGERWPSMQVLLDALVGAQTHVRRRFIGAGAAVVGLGLAGVLVASRMAESRAAAACDAEARSIDAIWPGGDDAARQRVHAAFVATELGYAEDTFARASGWLDDWTAAWRDQRRSACDAGRRGRDPHVQAAAITCLDEHAASLEGLVETLGEADARAVRRAVGAAASLPRIEPCADEQALAHAPRPPDGADGDRVTAIRHALGRARSLRSAGRYEVGREVADAAVADAEALGWPPLVAIARLDAGRAADLAGDPSAAERDLSAAYLAALSLGDDALAADAATTLVSVVGVDEGRPDDGVLWGLHAEALLQRIGETEGLTAASLDLKRARLDRVAGDYDRAIARLERSIALREAMLGEGHPDLAGPLTNLANVHLDRGGYDDAMRLYERALAGFEASVGPDHPDTAQALNNLGSVWFHRGDDVKAEALFRRALDIRERSLGPMHPDVAESLCNVAIILMMRGDGVRSIHELERAIAILERVHGPDSIALVPPLSNLAIAHAQMGELDDADRINARALAILERVHGGDHLDVARMLATIAEMKAARGDFDDAAPLAERAVGMAERSVGSDHPDLARALWILGEIEVERDDPTRGKAMCSRAQEIQARAGDDGPSEAHACLVAAELAEGHLDAAVEAGEREIAELAALGTPPDQGAYLRFIVARARWDADRDRDRALVLAREADAGLGSGQPHAKTKVKAWLRERTGG